MKSILGIIVFTFIAFSSSNAQNKEVIEAKFNVYGNCDMCKNRIEEAVNIDEVKYAKWNKTNKTMKVFFESTITVDSLQTRIAQVGHDTDKFKAPDDVYKELPGCCLYRDNSNTH
ncbi:heavy-metal-associated domain-containing protein [Bacteroidota bacterium]